MRTALITVVHGRHEHLRRQVRGVALSAAPPDVHIVVALDDPAVRDVLGECGSSAAVLDCAAGRRLPLAAARNRGADAALDAGADLLVFLDVDCIPSTALFRRYRAAAAMADHRDALLCGPVTYLPPPGPQGYDLTDLDSRVDPHPARPSPDGHSVVDTTDYTLFWSLSFALGRTTWDALGGFCEDYEGYGGEDTDFGQVARSRGVPMRWVGGAHAFHQHHDVHSPPVGHLDDIIGNSIQFHGRWGWWPMAGWLDAFHTRGLITRDPDGTPHRLASGPEADQPSTSSS